MKSKEERTHSTKADPGGSPDPELADALRAKSPDGKIGCAQAFDTARSTGRSPAVVGKALDDWKFASPAANWDSSDTRRTRKWWNRPGKLSRTLRRTCWRRWQTMRFPAVEHGRSLRFTAHPK